MTKFPYRRPEPAELGTYCVFLMAFLSFIPNPAMAIGQNSVLQAVNVAALLLLAFRVSRVSRVVRLVWLTTSIPALVTLGWYCLTGVYIVETAKICAPWILYTGQVVVAFGGNHRERELMLKGIFAGIFVNAVVCVLQSITVPLEMFPLEAIYPPAVVDSIA